MTCDECGGERVAVADAIAEDGTVDGEWFVRMVGSVTGDFGGTDHYGGWCLCGLPMRSLREHLTCQAKANDVLGLLHSGGGTSEDEGLRNLRHYYYHLEEGDHLATFLEGCKVLGYERLHDAAASKARRRMSRPPRRGLSRHELSLRKRDGNVCGKCGRWLPVGDPFEVVRRTPGSARLHNLMLVHPGCVTGAVVPFRRPQ